jgi:hypothetical protein
LFFQKLISGVQIQMESQLLIKFFVQNVLGCTCPDKVFEQIEDNPVLPSTAPHSRSISIGGRLLIYVWEVEDGFEELQEGLLAMLEAGKKERDADGLNRFRAVLAVENPQIIALKANFYFSRFEGKDDRMHIHVIPLHALKNF